MGTVEAGGKVYHVLVATGFAGLCRACQQPINANEPYIRRGMHRAFHARCLRPKR